MGELGSLGLPKGSFFVMGESEAFGEIPPNLWSFVLPFLLLLLLEGDVFPNNDDGESELKREFFLPDVGSVGLLVRICF